MCCRVPPRRSYGPRLHDLLLEAKRQRLSPSDARSSDEADDNQERRVTRDAALRTVHHEQMPLFVAQW